MGLRRILSRWAEQAAVPIFPLSGEDGSRTLETLRLDDRIRFVESPRSANVLLAVGAPTSRLVRPAIRLHDQMSHPRATVWIPGDSRRHRLVELFPPMTVLDEGTDPIEAVVAVHRALLRGTLTSEPPVLPDEDPNPWRGVGPYGQGGKGMTGGVPYGRPMAERAPDRDGLELDVLDREIGPFFPGLPPGLVLTVRLQGDVIQWAEVELARTRGDRRSRRSSIHARALVEPVLVRDLELRRAEHHLRWLAGTLRFHGLHSLGRRVLALGLDLPSGAADDLRRLARLLDRSWTLGWSTRDVGILPKEIAFDGGGFVARASGVGLDARAEDPAYTLLGFKTVTQEAGDARARWRQRLAEAEQALTIAARAGDRRREPGPPVEWPRAFVDDRGDPRRDALKAIVPDLLTGAEWGDALATIVSLDLPTGLEA